MSAVYSLAHPGISWVLQVQAPCSNPHTWSAQGWHTDVNSARNVYRVKDPWLLCDFYPIKYFRQGINVTTQRDLGFNINSFVP